MDQVIFTLSNLVVMPFWFLIIVLPRWQITELILKSPLIVVPPALLYAFWIFPVIGEIAVVLVRPTLSDVSILLGAPTGATIAWAHIVTLDLFLGRWVYLDGTQMRLNPWMMAPVLVLCLFLGPIGLLSYLVIRAVYRRRALAVRRA